MPEPQTLLIGYLAAVSLLSVIACCYDKFAAKHAKNHRTREASLLLLSLIGGSAAMLATMLIIRHKTKHIKFMVGIPLILLLQGALICFLLIR